MIGSIRKHSKVLWWVIAALTIVSFVFFMGSGPVHNGSGSSQNPYGIIYGQSVTTQEFREAQSEFYIYYRLHYGQWPDENAGITHDDIERETYFRLLLARKAEKLDIHVGDQALVSAAAEFLRNIGQNGQAVPMQEFVQRYLAPKGFTALDLQNFLRGELVVQQLIQTLGLPGALVTPQEAGLMYDQEYREVSSQIVFFSASNYLARATVTPASVAMFYTNNMAAYREPDRVQVSYVFFDVTNFLDQSKAEWAKTNFEENVDAYYNQNSAQFADAKTPEEAKAKIREQLIRMRALMDARESANGFASELFGMEPVKPENFTALAQKAKLAVHTTEPFDENYGPTDFDAPSGFAKAAFGLTSDVPFGGPVIGRDGVYVISLVNKLPSTIPALEQIRPRVTQDLQHEEAIALARAAGTNFFVSLTVQMSMGKTFAQAAVAASQVPLVLPPFSLSTADLSELGDHADIRQVKQAAFTTQPGHVSSFVPTLDGGFVLYVHEMLPLDEAKKTAGMPQFLTQVRNSRQNEAFNLWIRAEASRELRDTPLFKKETATASPTAANQVPAQ